MPRWILLKFLLTIVAIVVLLRQTQDVSRVSRLARETTMSSVDFRPELIHAAGGLLAVLAATLLSVFKPWGMTPYGLRKVSQADLPFSPSDAAVFVREPVVTIPRLRWGRIIGVHAIILALLLVLVLHLASGGLHHH
jgi:hypothetical protein